MDWNEVKKRAKLVSRYDAKTNDWECLEIVNINDLVSLGLDAAELSKVKKSSISTTVVKPNGEEENTDVIPIYSLANILKMEI
ncbi:hypothetical protein [Porphyromonas somerae]|uniref:hypothetical protein n=1 Tax=Porphyromonas somerae TaxID=322095 RepID=UPI002A840626|nr:hypothetical protein [Porphyromonas somerae]MDY3884826.1 hypothetical protein [Porphyromonas somerae]